MYVQIKETNSKQNQNFNRSLNFLFGIFPWLRLNTLVAITKVTNASTASAFSTIILLSNMTSNWPLLAVMMSPAFNCFSWAAWNNCVPSKSFSMLVFARTFSQQIISVFIGFSVTIS